ncbi:monocarboxylate transporter 12-like [Saccoglossus kowalevskii]|uniref:Monocarboxylate transporter 12-like n=1 Tax=Saccoglossus kowalevskii TaxID=10224 RepID=A0ABM0MYQ7_SACKO|nr:PREDICTED: monocarboxylate transporter 12-like [Saccoglossus kowalevskii]
MACNDFGGSEWCCGWLIVLSSHSLQMLMAGCQLSMGVFLVKFMDYFGEGAGKTASIVSLQSGVMFFPGPLVSILNNKFGTKPLVVIGGVLSSTGIFFSAFANSVNIFIFSYGITVGFAFALVYGPSVVIVGQYFHKRHALANGIVFAGFGVGIMVFPPLYQTLIDKYGWRGAMIVMAGINMNIVVCGMLMRPPPKYDREVKNGDVNGCTYVNQHECANSLLATRSSESRKDDGNKEIRNSTSLRRKITHHLALQLYTNSWFRILCVTVLIAAIGQLVLLVHIVNRAVSDGIPALDSAFLMTIIGISTMQCMPLFAALYGIADSMSVPLHSVVSLKHCIGTENLSSAVGWYLFYGGIGYILGPPFGGWIYDISLNYDLSFIAAGCSLLLAAFLILMQIVYKRCQSQNTENRYASNVTRLHHHTDISIGDAICETSL